jgi:hypothetical protein
MVAEGQQIGKEQFGILSGGKDNPRTFSEEEEMEIKDYVIEMSQRGFPMIPEEVRELAHDFAERNRKVVSSASGEMSYNWQRRWERRMGGELALTVPKPMSLYRATAGGENKIKEWFQTYEELLEEQGICQPQFIWNVDETGVTENPASRKAYVQRYSKTPFVVPGDKGTTTTILSFLSASGLRSPPMIIFKGLRVQESWSEYMPKEKGWLLRCSESGWITKRLFSEFANTFIHWLHSIGLLGHNHLVVLDGHRTHTHNVAFLATMKQNNIDVLCLPPHCSHFLQPADLTPFSSFKRMWNKELRIFNRRHVGKKMTKPQFFLVFPRAWRLSMTTENIKEGFRSSGLWPVDRTAIHPDHYRVAEALKSEIILNSLIVGFCSMRVSCVP